MYARNNIFKRVQKKHGQDIIGTARTSEQLKTKHMKTQADIKFIKNCKLENLLPTFAKVNLSIKAGSYKLKRHIARIVMKCEMKSKHREKKKLQKDIRSLNIQPKTFLNLIMNNTLIHQINIVIKSLLESLIYVNKRS